MAIPQYTPAPNPGNLIASATPLGASGTYGALLDATAVFEAQVTGKLQTGATTPSATAGVKMEAYHILGAASLSGAVAVGGTSLSVASAAGIQAGQVIAVENETVTVSAVSGTTLTVSAAARAHAAGAPVYLIEQTATASVQPGPASGAYAANAAYSKTLYLSTSKYFFLMTNLDATSQSVTIEATVDLFSGVA